jgi:tetratricopeptide (TPR) repeat protein
MKALVTLEQAVFSRGAITEYVELLDRALVRAESAPPDSAGALTGMVVRQTRARFDATRGRSARALADLSLCLEAARARHDVRREGAVLLDLGVVRHLERALGPARECYEAALGRLSDPADAGALGRCIGNIGAVCHDEGKLVEASRQYRQAIAILGEAGETRRRANFIGNLAVLEQELGHRGEARSLFKEALCLLEPLRDARLLAIALGNYGVLELEEGQAARALELHTRAQALLAGSGDTPSRALCLGRLTAAMSLLGRTAEAEVRLRQAEHLAVQVDFVMRENIALVRGFLEIALANEERASGRPTAAEEHLSAARARVAQFVGSAEDRQAPCNQSDDFRAMLRILSALL